MGIVDASGAESRAFVSIRSIDDGDVDEVAFGQLDAAPALDQVTVDDGLELEDIGRKVRAVLPELLTRWLAYESS